MGSYGIGISRIPAAIIENNNDENGIIWPKEISPFDLMILNLLPEENLSIDFCENLHLELNKKKLDVLYDDRIERTGVKFSDADLIGIPYQVIIGKDFIKNKTIQIKNRKTLKKVELNKDDVVNSILSIIRND